jgi:isoprenylcysteine carboxyl methyltransferase (ICMT) family protein YpbQ
LTDKGTMSHRQVDQIDGEASAANLGSADHVYCVILALFAVVNWFVLNQANRDMTGLPSIATLVWSFMSLIVLILSLAQFWKMKSDRLVKLTRKTAPR